MLFLLNINMVNTVFAGRGANFDAWFEGREVGFVDFAEVESVGYKAFAAFYFDIIAIGALLTKNSSLSRQQW